MKKIRIICKVPRTSRTISKMMEIPESMNLNKIKKYIQKKVGTALKVLRVEEIDS